MALMINGIDGTARRKKKKEMNTSLVSVVLIKQMRNRILVTLGKKNVKIHA